MIRLIPMPQSSSRPWLLLMALGCVGLLNATTDPDIAAITGAWRGQSVCVTDAPACHNENVVYYVKEVPGRVDVVFIQADKVVDGKAITMGSGQWLYQRSQRTLELNMPQQAWVLKVEGTHIEGTLTLADKSIFRKMTLDKKK